MQTRFERKRSSSPACDHSYTFDEFSVVLATLVAIFDPVYCSVSLSPGNLIPCGRDLWEPGNELLNLCRSMPSATSPGFRKSEKKKDWMYSASISPVNKLIGCSFIECIVKPAKWNRCMVACAVCNKLIFQESTKRTAAERKYPSTHQNLWFSKYLVRSTFVLGSWTLK